MITNFKMKMHMTHWLIGIASHSVIVTCDWNAVSTDLRWIKVINQTQSLQNGTRPDLVTLRWYSMMPVLRMSSSTAIRWGSVESRMTPTPSFLNSRFFSSCSQYSDPCHCHASTHTVLKGTYTSHLPHPSSAPGSSPLVHSTVTHVIVTPQRTLF